MRQFQLQYGSNWVFRFIVTADSGIVTRDSGHRDRG